MFQYEFALPKKDYQLSIQTNSEVPISVSLYGQAKPMIELNQHEFGKYSSVDFVVRIYQGEGGIAARNIQKLFGNAWNQRSMVKGFAQTVKEFQSRL